MFDNIGGKIKKLAVTCAIICVAGGILIALMGAVDYFSNSDYMKYASVFGGAGYKYPNLTKAGTKAYEGLQMLKLGPFVSIVGFFSAWPMYGFGELIEKVTFIAEKIKDNVQKDNASEVRKTQENRQGNITVTDDLPEL